MNQAQFNYEIDSYQAMTNQSIDLTTQALTLNIAGSMKTGANMGYDQARRDTNHDYYIKQQMAQIEKQAMLPDTASLSSSNATMLGYNLMNNNIFSRYTIKNQFAKRIDDFFDMYGYLTNEVKIPNINNRPNWNYIKTIGANIVGNIPENALLSLKSFFDSGITLWHNPNNFLDYSKNNR